MEALSIICFVSARQIVVEGLSASNAFSVGKACLALLWALNAVSFCRWRISVHASLAFSQTRAFLTIIDITINTCIFLCIELIRVQAESANIRLYTNSAIFNSTTYTSRTRNIGAEGFIIFLITSIAIVVPNALNTIINITRNAHSLELVEWIDGNCIFWTA